MIYLDLEDLLHIAERALGETPQVRDMGLLDAAATRPRTSVFGDDAYPDLETKAAALLDSVANNHALIDGHKRLALAATFTFLGINGRRLTLTNDEAYDLIVDVTSGRVTEVPAIADRIRAGTTPW